MTNYGAVAIVGAIFATDPRRWVGTLGWILLIGDVLLWIGSY